MAKEEGDQHVAHMAFKIPDFWPHDPTSWFHKIESKFRICNIEVCSNINTSLMEIDKNAADAYKQLKGLLMSCHVARLERSSCISFLKSAT
jgi:hypothetical protein